MKASPLGPARSAHESLRRGRARSCGPSQIEELAKKRAAREKRENNKRKRDEELAAAMDPTVVERNEKIVGKWDLEIRSPERCAGTKAELVFGCPPPTGWPGK